MEYGLDILRDICARPAKRVIGTITHVSTREAVAALTFDDGPHPEFTPRLLEILERHGQRATFFMVGEAARRHPELVRRAAQAGHAIGNHTWNHAALPFLPGRERRAQIASCERALAPYGLRLFRPPYGAQNLASRLDVMWLGYQVVTWSVHVEDWLDHDARSLADGLLSKIQPGSVILLHDALYPLPGERSLRDERYADRQPMLEAVTMLLERLRDRFRFVTIPELFQCGRPQRRYWLTHIFGL